MGGGGSALGMIQSLRDNKNLLSKKSRFKKEWGLDAIKKDYTKGESGQLYFKSPTKVDLLSNRRTILKEKRRDRLIIFGMFFTLMIAVTVGTYQLVNMQTPKISPVAHRVYDPPEPTNDDQYTYFITAGDEWINKEKWYNAAFEYQKALEIYPGNYVAKYRLAMAWGYYCIEEGKDCDPFFNLIDPMISSYPDEVQLYRLRSSVYTNLGDLERAAADLVSIKVIEQKKKSRI